MRYVISVVVLGFGLALASQEASAILIDDFTFIQSVTQNGEGTTLHVAACGASCIGGQRELALNQVAGGNSSSVNVNTGVAGHLTFNNGVGVRSNISVLWDGNGAAGNQNALAANLSADAAGFLIAATSDVGATGTVRVYSGAGNYSEANWSIPSGLAMQTTTVLFANFVSVAGTGANFANVSAIELRVNGGDSLDVKLGRFETTNQNDATIAVQIDIKPGTSLNTVNLRSAGVIPVAILGGAALDVADIDPSTLRLSGAETHLAGKSGKSMCSVEFVDGDNYPDLLCHFQTDQLSLQVGDSIVTLHGQTFGGKPIQGEDNVTIVP